MEKVGKYPFMAEPFRCDFSGHLFMGHLGNHLLNAADFHASDRGFGVEKLNAIHRAWVISRMVIEMDTMPAMYTPFYIETWVESVKRFFTHRDFRVFTTNPDGSEKDLGYGRFIWAMIDTETRQPVDIMTLDGVRLEEWLDSDKPCPIERSSRVNVSADAPLICTFDTHYTDVDINGHVNSIKYIERVLDLWPLDWYRDYNLKRIEVAYVVEAHPNDRLSIYREQVGDLEYAFRIVLPNGSECCRLKLVWRNAAEEE